MARRARCCGARECQLSGELRKSLGLLDPALLTRLGSRVCIAVRPPMHGSAPLTNCCRSMRRTVGKI